MSNDIETTKKNEGFNIYNYKKESAGNRRIRNLDNQRSHNLEQVRR